METVVASVESGIVQYNVSLIGAIDSAIAVLRNKIFFKNAWTHLFAQHELLIEHWSEYSANTINELGELEHRWTFILPHLD